MNDILRVGIAGLGEAATEFLPVYARHPRIKLVACADARSRARERFESDFGGRSFVDIQTLCEHDGVDVIVVATNHEYHLEPTSWAAENGKHVIVEKPMALTMADCDAMIDVCNRHGVLLLGGHNHSYDPPVRAIRGVVNSGELGRLRMINGWNFNDFMVRPYPDEHLAQSAGVVLNQGAHHVDVVRLIGGGLLRSVRAMVGTIDESRPGFGIYSAWMEFVDGTVCTLVYNGSGFFDTAELFGWIGEGGQPRQVGTNQASRRNFVSLEQQDRRRVMDEMKERLRYGSVGLGERAQMPAGWEKGGRPPVSGPLPTHQPFFGFLLVTFEGGDIRQSVDGLTMYGDERREVELARWPSAREAEIDELWQAIMEGRPLIHDGNWGKASIEVCLAMIRSAQEGREIFLQHQVSVNDGWAEPGASTARPPGATGRTEAGTS